MGILMVHHLMQQISKIPVIQWCLPVKPAIFMLVYATFTPFSHSVTAQSQGISDYASCTELAAKAPSIATQAAADWRDNGGGFAARHCLALAIRGSGQYRVAASRLESLARDMAADGQPEQAAEIIAQAALIWTEANEPVLAVNLLNDALTWSPEKPSLLVDRAHAHIARNQMDLALKDLDEAIIQGTEDADAFALRALIRRQAGDTDEAYADIARALTLEPGQPNALLERARIRIQVQDLAGARRDLAVVLQHHADDPAAETARQILQQLEAE